MTANADTAVWLHAQEHTTSPTLVPGSHSWQVIIVNVYRDKHRGSPARVDGQVARMYHPARRTAKALPHQPHPTAGPHHGRSRDLTNRPPPGSALTRALSTAGQLKPSKLRSPATEASCTSPTITRKRATPYGGNTPRQKWASNHQPSNLASARSSQQSSTLSPPWPSKLGRHPNGHRASSKRRRHATVQHLHTSGDTASIHPYRTSTSLPRMRGWSTSSCPPTPHATHEPYPITIHL